MKKIYSGLLLPTLLVPVVLFAQRDVPNSAARQARHAEMLAKRGQRSKQDVKAIERTAPRKAADASVTTIYGCVLDSYSEDYYYGPGIYSFTNESSNTSFSFVKEDVDASWGGVYVEGKYYAIRQDESGANMMSVYDVSNGFSKIGDDIATDMLASDLAYDPTSGTVYGSFSADGMGTWVWGSLNLETGEVTTLGASTRKAAVACQKDGDVYAIDLRTSQLQYIDKATGAATDIAQIEMGLGDYEEVIAGWQSGVFDWKSDVMYWSCYNVMGNSGLVAISLSGEGASATLASKTLVKNYSYWVDDPLATETTEQVCGLFIIQSAVSDSTPSEVTNLVASFEGGSLSGKVEFTMPSVSSTGKDLEGKQLSYSIKYGGNEIIGNANAGSAVSEPVTVAADGLYTFTISVTNDGEASKNTTLTAYIGNDAPSAPKNVKLTVNGNNTSVSWDAVNTGENGGYVGDITYNVTRQPEGMAVATGLKTTSFSETITNDVKYDYWYDVQAVSNGIVGKAGASDKFQYGCVLPVPYSETFDSANDASGYIFIDGNKDNCTWSYIADDNTEKTERQNLCYTYSSSNDADDWALTPEIHFEAGNLYELSFTLRSNWDQNVSVWMGQGTTAADMTLEVAKEFTHTGNYYQHSVYKARVIPQTTGAYRLGFHVTTPKDATDLFLDNIQVNLIPGNAPASPENFAVTAGEKGALKATVTFNVPSKTINGKAIDSVSKVVLTRDGEVLTTITGVTPGQLVSYDDTDVRNGIHTYAANAVSGDEEGDIASADKYIGVDIPGSVRNLKVVEDWKNNPGTIIATWDAPSEVGQNGGYVDPEALTYFEYNAGVSTNLGSAKTLSAKIDISKGQTVNGFCIYADNSIGSGKGARITASCMVGPAKMMPLYESFPGVSVKSGPWSYTLLKGDTFEAYWDVNDGQPLISGTQDGDGGVCYFDSYELGNISRYRSPKIDVRGATNPTFIFYVYHTGKKDALDIDVSKEYGEYVTAKHIVMDEQPIGWHRYEVPLNDYADCEFLQVGLTGYSVESTSHVLYVDNMSIRDYVASDLELMSFTAPVEIKVGKAGEFSVKIANRGAEKVKGADYTVELYKNGVKCSEIDGIDVEADRSTTITITDTPTIDDPINSVYYAKINYSADNYDDNNTSDSYDVRLSMPLYPAATELTATQDGDGVDLAWNEPDVATMQAEPTLDDFESYSDYAMDGVGEWKFVDGDKSKTKLISVDGVNPLVYPSGEPMAYIVYNPEDVGLYHSAWKPKSGNKMLVAFSATSTNDNPTCPANDDWLISPELNGLPQTISFFAKVGLSGATELFDFSYSTTDDAVESFKAENTESFEITNYSEWNEFRITIPAGAKYFAIRYKSCNQLALLLDDISYVPAGKLPEEVSLIGYNVYRNGEKINSELVGDTEYTDSNVNIGNSYTYKVTAVYDKGESFYSNEAAITFSSIAEIAGREVKITTLDEAIRIEGAEGMNVSVCNVAGIQLFSAKPSVAQVVKVSRGIYVVTVNGKSIKVAVR